MGLAGGRRGRSAPAAIRHSAAGPPAPGPGKGRGRLGRPWRRWGALALALAAAGWVLLVAATATSRYLNQSTVLRQRASLPAMPPIAVPADGQRDEPGEPGPTGAGCGGEGGPACPPFAATDADDLLSTPDCEAQLGLFRARFDELRAAGCPAADRRRAVADATEAALYSALWDQHPPFDPAAAAARLDLWDGLGDEEKAAGEAGYPAARAARERVALDLQRRFAEGGQQSGADCYRRAAEVVRDLVGSRCGTVLASCRRDPSLEGAVGVPAPAAATLVVATFHNSQRRMLNTILALLRLASTHPEGRLVVSVYEAGSQDLTAGWLDVLEAALAALGVPVFATTHGALVRWTGQEPEEHQALVRNSALEVLWERDLLLERNAVLGAGRAVEKVVFLDEVFVCPEDVARLVGHDADLACGMAFAPNLSLREMKHHYRAQMRAFMARRLARTWGLPEALGRALARNSAAFRWHFASARRGSAQREFLRATFPFFAGAASARDAAGQPLWARRPYVAEPLARERLKRGLPFPVHSCGSGLAAVDARVFRHALKFRMHATGECYSNEWVLFGDDLFRLGYTRKVMDPGVRVAREQDVAEMAKGLKVEKVLPFAPWWAVAAEALGTADFARPGYVAGGRDARRSPLCCPFRTDARGRPSHLSSGQAEHVNHAKCYEDDRLFTTNFTSSCLRVFEAQSLIGREVPSRGAAETEGGGPWASATADDEF